MGKRQQGPTHAICPLIGECEPSLVTLHRFAEWSGISYNRAWLMATDGRLPAFKTGGMRGTWRVCLDCLDCTRWRDG